MSRKREIYNYLIDKLSDDGSLTSAQNKLAVLLGISTRTATDILYHCVLPKYKYVIKIREIYPEFSMDRFIDEMTNRNIK